MPAATRSKLCSSVSAWLGVFASNAMSSASSASVIVFVGYILPLFFFSSKLKQIPIRIPQRLHTEIKMLISTKDKKVSKPSDFEWNPLTKKQKHQ